MVVPGRLAPKFVIVVLVANLFKFAGTPADAMAAAAALEREGEACDQGDGACDGTDGDSCNVGAREGRWLGRISVDAAGAVVAVGRGALEVLVALGAVAHELDAGGGCGVAKVAVLWTDAIDSVWVGSAFVCAQDERRGCSG